MNKLVILRNLSPKYLQQLKEIAPNWEIVISKDSSVYVPHLSEAEIVVGWNEKYAKECFKTNSPLRWIHSWGAGVSTMPLKEMKKADIVLTNTSGVHAFPISETVIAMMLNLTRNIHIAIRGQLKKEWNRETNLIEMHGKTIGIIGVGAIGEETARLTKAFGMRVLGARRSGKSSPVVDEMYNMEGLNELLKQSDYIVNILPSTKETYKLINAEQFAQMKSTAFYINVGRGETTDTKALINALEQNIIAGAALDVFEQEPLPKESALWDLENLIITSHCSGLTVHYEERAMELFITIFKDYLKGIKPIINRVDLDKEY